MLIDTTLDLDQYGKERSLYYIMHCITRSILRVSGCQSFWKMYPDDK